MCNKFTKFIFVLLIIAFIPKISFAQSEGNRLAFGVNYGLVKYWGEFTDNQFWWGGDLFLRYNIVPNLSLQATFGLAAMRYKIENDDLAKYPGLFGPDAVRDATQYPKTNTTIRDKNQTRLNTYEMYLTYNFFSSESYVPFIFGGVGLLNFEPKAGETGYEGTMPLHTGPENTGEEYERNVLVFPVGIGFEAYITDSFVLNGRATYRLGGTDYLDALSQDVDGAASAENDRFLTFGVGFSYYVLGDADYDKDGLTNRHEERIGTDPHNPDTDGDGLSDGDEVKVYKTDPLRIDTDSDNLTDFDEINVYGTNPRKADTDGDGLNDGDEVARKTDPLNPDTDGDGLTDGDEVLVHKTDPLNADSDGDGLTDGEEINKYNTNPKNIDTDSDGLSDGDEVLVYKSNPNQADTDQDGLNDGTEVNIHKTDPINPDTDGDGLTDGAEVNEYKTDPLNPDTDGDGLSDGDEVKKHKTDPLVADTDKDGLSDGDEVNIHKTDPTVYDMDNDGLSDGEEIALGTDPRTADTDGDGLLDGEEVKKYKTDPLNADTDGDTLSDGDEVNKTFTDPLKADTDGDGINDNIDACPLIAGLPSDDPKENGCPQAPKVGTKTDFPDILFIVNTDDFNYESFATSQNLAKLLEYVKQCEKLQVKIEGHASQEGNAKRNQELSEMRAKKVRDWLIEQGVSQDKIFGAIGYGAKEPKIDETKQDKSLTKDELEAIRAQNRRITVEVKRGCDGETK